MYQSQSEIRKQPEVHLSSWCVLWGTNPRRSRQWAPVYRERCVWAIYQLWEPEIRTMSKGDDQKGCLGVWEHEATSALLLWGDLWLHRKWPSAGAHREQNTTTSRSSTAKPQSPNSPVTLNGSQMYLNHQYSFIFVLFTAKLAAVLVSHMQQHWVRKLEVYNISALIIM